MNFKVDPSPQVTQAVNACSPALQLHFKQVVSILSDYPYEFGEVIQKHIAGDGRDFYTYYDGLIPLVFTYRVYPPEDQWEPGRIGFVPIQTAAPPRW